MRGLISLLLGAMCLIPLAGCSADALGSQEDYTAKWSALAAAQQLQAPNVIPDTPVKPGICSNCNGKGRLGDGVVSVPCPACGGDGKVGNDPGPGAALPTSTESNCTCEDCGCGWKRGPLPANTFGWGGVVPVDLKVDGFFFADFAGDKVTLSDGRVLKAHEVAQWNNRLSLPPGNKASGTQPVSFGGENLSGFVPSQSQVLPIDSPLAPKPQLPVSHPSKPAKVQRLTGMMMPVDPPTPQPAPVKQVLTTFSSGGCANGNCSIGGGVRFRFRRR
ncbi:hypothetical protein NA78x_001753 [Anatilimnocola sp. NA78]|uniref:hypothetical protein n=1 Tax=Anatilimnocola sp. NA78 TaxID=3415683 RepID=UPI003CE5B50D